MKKVFCFLIVSMFCINPVGIGLAAEKTIVIRIGNIYSMDTVINYGCKKFKNIMEERTDGRVKVKIYPNSQLGPAVSMLGAVKKGSQEIFVGANGWAARFTSEFQLLNPPFAWKTKDEKRAFIDSPFHQESKEKVRKKHGIVILADDWYRGSRCLFTKKPVRKLEEIKGMKIRVPKSQAKIAGWKALGAAPTPMPWGELYMGLKTNIVDGLESPLDTIAPSKLYEVAKYFTYTDNDFIWSAVYCNEKFYLGLPEDIRGILHEALREASTYHNKTQKKLYDKYYEEMENAGVTFIKLGPEERQRWYDVGQKCLLELEKTKKWWPKGTVEEIKKSTAKYR